MKNFTNILRSKLTRKGTNEKNSCMFNENFEQLFSQTQSHSSYVINLSKFNYNDIECTSSPIVNQEHKIIKHKSINMQKFRQALASKFKNIIKKTPKKLCIKLNETFKSSNKIKNVKLLNYNQYSASLSTAIQKSDIENKRRFINDTNGFQSSSYVIPNPLFISTPNEDKRVRITSNNSFYKIKQPSFDNDDEIEINNQIEIIDENNNDSNSVYNDNNDDETTRYVDAESNFSQYQTYNHSYNSKINDNNNKTNSGDESTQVNINAPPKLIESTLNSSSLSNMSNDLIILQHVFQHQPQFKENFTQLNIKDASYKSWNSMVIKKFHENTNASFTDLPSWATGNQLNLALVNQLYYNPNGKGVFKPLLQ